MAFIADEAGVMSFNGIKFVEKNTFLHFIKDAARASRRRSAPALMLAVDSEKFFPSLQQLPTMPTKPIARPASKHNDQPVEWAEDVQTVMIRGIPCSCKREDILIAIEELGFREHHDFFFVPTRRGRILGYAFIGFTNSQLTKKFAKAMTGYSFKGKQSTKIVTVTPASIQGADNFEHFKDTYVMQSSTKPVFIEQRKK